MDFSKLSQQASSFLSNKQGPANTDAAPSTDTAAADGTDNTGAAPPADNGAGAAPGTDSTQTNDYGDKAFAFLEQKTGKQVSRETEEQITDGARGLFEKATGKKVDPKFSN